MIEILTSGGLNAVQDLGRRGHLDIGVSRSGAMDRPALEVANQMLGNPADAAGLEIAIFPFRLRFARATAFSVTGADAPVALDGRRLPPWWAAEAPAGARLEIGLPRNGQRCYVALAGGIDVPLLLGSRATDLKSGWGGFEGRSLKRGDHLPLGESHWPLPNAAGFGLDPALLRPWPEAGQTLRVLPGAEFAAFAEQARAAVFQAEWRVTDEANRQGYRLAGPALQLSEKLELFSHGLMPGTVQVPPSGQPIIQLAEANTCGGYPKIANVIEADLWRLAQAPIGSLLRFSCLRRDQAIEALRRERQAIAELAAFAALARADDRAPSLLAGLGLATKRSAPTAAEI